MYTSFLLLAVLSLHVAPSSAGLFSSGTKSFQLAARQAHDIAIRHSAGLAHDIRLAMRGVLVAQDPTDLSSIYCIPSSDDGGGGGIGIPSVDGNGTTTTPNSGDNTTTTSNVASPWKLWNSYEGETFFDGWAFFTEADPTDGSVTYVDQSTANSSGLIDINSSGNAIMRVETTEQVANNRQSVRITTNAVFTGGLVIMDSVHMPTGCGTWPAFWTDGPNWPAGGEIDIVEGVNNYTNNQATIHTNPGCSIPSSNSTALNMTGNVVGGTDCSAAETDNQGCGITSNSDISFGTGFNANNGGVYAMIWTEEGIAVYFFPRSSVPSDITEGAPQPSNWSTPMARWPSTNCNTTTFFYDHSAIFDTTLCGQWAGEVWNSTGMPGQSQSCYAETGYATCDEFVQASGSSFDEAYWEVSSVKIYQLESSAVNTSTTKSSTSP